MKVSEKTATGAFQLFFYSKFILRLEKVPKVLEYCGIFFKHGHSHVANLEKSDTKSKKKHLQHDIKQNIEQKQMRYIYLY